MHKTAVTDVPIHPFLAERWSPRSFDAAAEIDTHELVAMFEAARWAPSSNNFQEWRFAVTRRGDSNFAAVIETLAGFNKAWSPRASAFIVAAAERTAADGSERKWADYDLGNAVGLLTVQAHSMGWHVHQIGGFDAAALRQIFPFTDGTVPLAIIAVGRLADADQLEDAARERELAPRTRLPLEQIVVAGLN